MIRRKMNNPVTYSFLTAHAFKPVVGQTLTSRDRKRPTGGVPVIHLFQGTGKRPAAELFGLEATHAAMHGFTTFRVTKQTRASGARYYSPLCLTPLVGGKPVKHSDCEVPIYKVTAEAVQRVWSRKRRPKYRKPKDFVKSADANLRLAKTSGASLPLKSLSKHRLRVPIKKLRQIAAEIEREPVAIYGFKKVSDRLTRPGAAGSGDGAVVGRRVKGKPVIKLEFDDASIAAHGKDKLQILYAKTVRRAKKVAAEIIKKLASKRKQLASKRKQLARRLPKRKGKPSRCKPVTKRPTPKPKRTSGPKRKKSKR